MYRRCRAKLSESYTLWSANPRCQTSPASPVSCFKRKEKPPLTNCMAFSRVRSADIVSRRWMWSGMMTKSCRVNRWARTQERRTSTRRLAFLSGLKQGFAHKGLGGDEESAAGLNNVFGVGVPGECGQDGSSGAEARFYFGWFNGMAGSHAPSLSVPKVRGGPGMIPPAIGRDQSGGLGWLLPGVLCADFDGALEFVFGLEDFEAEVGVGVGGL